MTLRRLRTRPPLSDRFDAIRSEVGVVEDFPPAALAEAQEAKALGERLDATDVPFVTIDPPGSRDLDQALHLERRGSGYRVRYAIADLAAFVTPGGALDAAVWERGVTYYAPDRATPLHPPVLSEGAASLLPDAERPAVLWDFELDAHGALERTRVARARVRSRARLDYAGVQAQLDDGTATEVLRLLAEVGALRLEVERERGGVSLDVPEQEVVPGPDGSWALSYRAPLPVESFNAQISLLTGIAAADLVLQAGTGVLRTLPPADAKALTALRRAAQGFGVPWPDGMPYPDFIRSLDARQPAHAALLRDATGVLRGAGYTVFDGERPADARHHAIADEYAHVTAPLRRLADRYAIECGLAVAAGEPPPAWVLERLDALPEAMRTADRRASALERAAVDLVEAAVLERRVGEVFDAVVIDEGSVQLLDPAVRARCDGDPPVGERVRVRLTAADVAARAVRFTV